MTKARIFATICFTAAISLLIATDVPAQEKPAAAPAASPIYPIQEGFVDAHGIMIYYKTIGRGAPLVIVHGGPGASHDYFLPYLLPLARHNKLIFIDERGPRRSHKLQNPQRS